MTGYRRLPYRSLILVVVVLLLLRLTACNGSNSPKKAAATTTSTTQVQLASKDLSFETLQATTIRILSQPMTDYMKATQFVTRTYLFTAADPTLVPASQSAGVEDFGSNQIYGTFNAAQNPSAVFYVDGDKRYINDQADGKGHWTLYNGSADDIDSPTVPTPPLMLTSGTPSSRNLLYQELVPSNVSSTSEVLNGNHTNHVQITFDSDAIAKDIPDEKLQPMLSDIPGTGSTIDIWFDDNRLPVKIVSKIINGEAHSLFNAEMGVTFVPKASVDIPKVLNLPSAPPSTDEPSITIPDH